MGFIREFKTFATRGNVVDLAVGVIIGTAFSKIVSSLVNNIVMPLVGIATGGLDFSKASVKFGIGERAAELTYGMFIQSVIDFIIIAFCIFLMVKLINRARRAIEGEPEAAVAPEAPEEIKLLREIRDALNRQNSLPPDKPIS